MKPRIQILMSTYNGGKYIEQQIESIIQQIDVETHILIRDDGSKDNTIEILKKYKNHDIEITQGYNVGATRSFFELIKNSGEYDYYAFADQDDVWDTDKLITAVNYLKRYTVPAIYSSNTRLVDSNLHNLKSIIFEPKITLGSALVKNYVAGCTAVMNKHLMSKLKSYIPENVPYHDWWANLVALSLGGVSLFDKSAHIAYRQHDRNVVGASRGLYNKWKNRLKKFLYQSYYRNRIAEQLLVAYSDSINEENKYILNLMANYRNEPIKLIKSGYFKTNILLDNLSFYICVLLKKA